MEVGSFVKLDVGYLQSQFINDDSNREFTYTGLYFNIGINNLHRKIGQLHTYWGLGLEFNQQDNTANDQDESEQAQHVAPSLSYRFVWKNFSILTAYNYVFAKHEGSGLRHSNLDFAIHKINIQASYILDIKPGWYFDLFYKYSTGLVFDLDDDHSYNDHVFGIGLIFQFGDASSIGNSSTSSKTKSRSNSNKKGKSKFDFFLY